jgi:transcriptional regulator with XRE-family HTH domain
LSPIASRVRSERQRRGWSREALAYRSGLSHAAVTQIESGRRQDVRLASLSALADALGVSIDYLVGRACEGDAPLLEHRAFVYASGSDFLATVVPFLRDGVRSGDAVLVVTTGKQIRRLRSALGDEASYVDFHSSAGWYRTPVETLDRYQAYLDRPSDRDGHWTRIIGEPVWAGRSAAEIEQWVRYESVINLSLRARPASIVCPYDASVLPSAVVDAARRTHPEIASGTGAMASAAYVEPESLLLA